MKQESFEDQLKNKSEQFSLLPKAGLWEAVEAGLAPEKKKRRVPVFWLLAGALGAGLLWYGVSQKPVAKMQSVEHHSEINKREPSTSVLDEQPISDVADHQQLDAQKGYQAASVKNRLLSNIKPQTHLTMVEEGQDLSHGFKVENGTELMEWSNTNTNTSGSGTVIKNETDDETLLQDTALLADTENSPVDTTVKDIAHIAIPKQGFRYYAGAIIAPLQSFAILRLSSPGAQSSADYTNRRISDKALYGYKAGFTAGIEKGRHSWHTGLLFNRMGYRMLLNNIDNRPPPSSIVVNSIRTVSKDSFKFTQPVDGGTYYSVQFNTLSVPVGYTFRMMEGMKWDLGLNASFTYHRLLSTSALMYDEQSGYYIRKQFTENSQLHKNTGIVAAGIDLNYRISSVFSLSLNPQVGRTINAIESGAIPTGLKYWSIGAGFRWYLN